jgi:hypothetical protein
VVERLIRNNQQQETAQNDEDNFGNAFQNVELSEAALLAPQIIRKFVKKLVACCPTPSRPPH